MSVLKLFSVLYVIRHASFPVILLLRINLAQAIQVKKKKILIDYEVRLAFRMMSQNMDILKGST